MINFSALQNCNFRRPPRRPTEYSSIQSNSPNVFMPATFGVNLWRRITFACQMGNRQAEVAIKFVCVHRPQKWVQDQRFFLGTFNPPISSPIPIQSSKTQPTIIIQKCWNGIFNLLDFGLKWIKDNGRRIGVNPKANHFKCELFL